MNRKYYLTTLLEDIYTVKQITRNAKTVWVPPADMKFKSKYYIVKRLVQIAP